MIRREAFGGIIFEERSHKIYTLDKSSFRLIELFFVSGLEIEKIQNILRNEFDTENTAAEIELFANKAKKIIGDEADQRGVTSDAIWDSGWNNQYFSAPVSNFWSFTNLCNLNCTHCAWNSSKTLPNELGTERCKQLIDEMLKMGVFELSFSGGEPLTKKNQLLEMGKYATKQGFQLGLATNATLINNEVAQELLDAGFKEVQVSVEGLEAHENIRGKGIWDRTIAGIRVLRENGFDITFSTTINKTNLNELNSIFETAKKEQIRNVRFVRFVPIGRGKKNNDIFGLSRTQEFQLARTLWEKRWELFPDIVVTFNKHFVSIGAIKDPGLGNIPKTFGWNWDCPSARSRICIMPQGKVAPCPLIGSLGLDGGDVTKTSLSDIWVNSPFFSLIRTDKRGHNPRCESCDLWKNCSGGCKAASYAHFDDLMKEDPLCLHYLE